MVIIQDNHENLQRKKMALTSQNQWLTGVFPLFLEA
jgi:hypothetical protein